MGPNPAAYEFDPLSPEFAGDLVRKTARILDGMDRVMRPGGIATEEGLSAAVRAGMQHVAAHNGDIRAALPSAKAAGASKEDTALDAARRIREEGPRFQPAPSYGRIDDKFDLLSDSPLPFSTGSAGGGAEAAPLHRTPPAPRRNASLIKVQVVTFGHGDRHVSDPESAQAEILQNLPPFEQIVGGFWGITPNFIYRAYPLLGGRLNIGTYYDR